MKRLTAPIAILTALGLFAGCAPHQPAEATSQSMVLAVASTAPGASPVWRYAVPADVDTAQVRVGKGAVAIGGRSQVIVLDLGTGRLRWARRDGAAAIGIGETVVYGSPTNALISRALGDGSPRWEHHNLCAAPPYAAPAGAAVVVRNARDVVVACNGGGLVRLDAASGSELARSDTAAQIRQIVPLGSCSYGVSGFSDGAILREHAAIVDCKRLATIVPDGEETWILGSIGENAILGCCMSAPDGQRPITIARANLATGAILPEGTLTPPAEDYPPNQCTPGQGWQPLLAHAQLYLAVRCSLYRYGDPRALSATPQRIADDFAEPPTPLRDGRLAARVHVAGATIGDEIVDVRNGVLEPLWSELESGPALFAYDPASAADVVTVLHAATPPDKTFVRTDDGAHLFVTDQCTLVGSSADLLVTICTTSTLVGHRYLQYIAAYRWHQAAATAR
jgi:hypothetical protein